MKDVNPSNAKAPDRVFDIVVIGGGINGCGIARDAVGRGLSVCLCEMNDLASATSSSSTKLFHGGLRYLEFFEFNLVRKALKEREVLLKMMPHIARPMRFVLPYDPDLRHPSELSTFGKALHLFMPFLKGRRPAWLIRSGLFIYDHLGGKQFLPKTTTLALENSPVGKPLKPRFKKAFEYSDGSVDDARLVVLNARDAADNGAEIHTRTKCLSAERVDGLWQIRLQNRETDQPETIHARCLINASGPWVDEILKDRLQQKSTAHIRLVRGSHIVVNKLFDHDQPYFFQLSDGRIIFAIPYETDFTLIGTTDHDHQGDPKEAHCTPEEMDYLLAATNQFFQQQITRDDVVWTYSGVRPLYDDNSGDATSATRDYVLTVLDADGQLPVLNIFGGKITTYRKLAEDALERLAKYFPQMSGNWTAASSLPGGDFAIGGVPQLTADLQKKFEFLDEKWARRLIHSYGTLAPKVLDNAQSLTDLGQNFGADLYEAEVSWLIDQEWAETADDVLWRRSKLGLRFNDDQVNALQDWLLNRALLRS